MKAVPISGTLNFFATSAEVAGVLSPWQGRLEGSIETWVVAPEYEYRVPRRQPLLEADDFNGVISDNFIQMIVRLRQRGVDAELAFAESQRHGRCAGYLVLQSGFSRWGKSDQLVGPWSLRACDKYLESNMPPAMPLFREIKPAFRRILKHRTCFVNNRVKAGPMCSSGILEKCKSGLQLTLGEYSPSLSLELQESLKIVPMELLQI